MDKKIEKSNHQKIIRRFTKRIRALDFEKHKSSFFLRKKKNYIQFIHIHKYTFTSVTESI